MKLLTTRTQIQGAAKRWRAVYGQDGNERYGADKAVKARALERLDGNTASADEVNEIIGNESWLRITCDECGKGVDAAVQVGQEPDYESSTATICFGCLHAAHKLFPLGTFQP